MLPARSHLASTVRAAARRHRSHAAAAARLPDTVCRRALVSLTTAASPPLPPAATPSLSHAVTTAARHRTTSLTGGRWFAASSSAAAAADAAATGSGQSAPATAAAAAPASAQGSADAVPIDKIRNDLSKDSNALERERGITILAKSTSLMHRGHRINLVDTPGHADFGGEVERVLSMVDACVLLVCATEGPMTQTRFVLAKALQRGLPVAVVLNKVDRDSARPGEVESDILDLFLGLGCASDEQLEYPVVHASAKEGWAVVGDDWKSADRSAGVLPLLDMIIDFAPAPKGDRSEPFKLLVTVRVRHCTDYVFPVLT
ncbi:hypothetical protein HK405_015817 [Cladochytrium tenue]|nr:hypothetical protein HK405_015817 [Cladochytrium tenue]